MVTSGTLPLQVALAHLMFNVTGILVFYPIPFMREIPMSMARFLGRMTQAWRGFPFLYILVAFFLIPLLALGLSTLFTEDSKGMTVLGVFLVVIMVIGGGWTYYYCKFQGGKEKYMIVLQKREKKRSAFDTLPDDIEYLKEKVALLLKNNEAEDKLASVDTSEDDV